MDVEIGSSSESMVEKEEEVVVEVRGSSSVAHGDGWELLGLARQLASQGKPSLALQAVSFLNVLIFFFFLEIFVFLCL